MIRRSFKREPRARHVRSRASMRPVQHRRGGGAALPSSGSVPLDRAALREAEALRAPLAWIAVGWDVLGPMLVALWAIGYSALASTLLVFAATERIAVDVPRTGPWPDFLTLGRWTVRAIHAAIEKVEGRAPRRYLARFLYEGMRAIQASGRPADPRLVQALYRFAGRGSALPSEYGSAAWYQARTDLERIAFGERGELRRRAEPAPEISLTGVGPLVRGAQARARALGAAWIEDAWAALWELFVVAQREDLSIANALKRATSAVFRAKLAAGEMVLPACLTAERAKWPADLGHQIVIVLCGTAAEIERRGEPKERARQIAVAVLACCLRREAAKRPGSLRASFTRERCNALAAYVTASADRVAWSYETADVHARETAARWAPVVMALCEVANAKKGRGGFTPRVAPSDPGPATFDGDEGASERREGKGSR